LGGLVWGWVGFEGGWLVRGVLQNEGERDVVGLGWVAWLGWNWPNWFGVGVVGCG
jgi:hypothetical protein